MHPALTRAAEARGVSLDVRSTGAEATGLPPASVDAVVCTLVLCTVPDPAAALEDVELVHMAGFAVVELESYRLRSVFLPVNQQVAGTAAVGESP